MRAQGEVRGLWGRGRVRRPLLGAAAAGLLAGAAVVGVAGSAAADGNPTVIFSSTRNITALACEPGTTACYGLTTSASNDATLLLPVSQDGSQVGSPVTLASLAGDRLVGLACPTSTLCLAVGTDGSNEHPFAVPISGGVAGSSVALPIGPEAITCPSAASCVVAGDSSSGTGAVEPLTVTGSTVTPGAAAAVSGSTELTSIACATAASCEVGGDSYVSGGLPTAGVVGSVNPASGGSAEDVPQTDIVLGIASTGTGYVAVGQANSSHGVVAAINGTTVAPTDLYNTGFLEGVSCVGATCEVVGGSADPSHQHSFPVAVPVIKGQAGAVRALTGLTFGEGANLGAITCTSTTECAAVGGQGNTATEAGIVGGVAPVGPATAVPPPDICSGNLNGHAVVGGAATRDRGGYWLTDAAGDVVSCGDAAADVGSPPRLTAPIVGMAAGPDDEGFYLVGADGGVFAEGTAPFHGSAGDLHLSAPVVGMAADQSSDGYWLVAADGGVFSYGGAPFEGSAGGLRLTKPVAGMAAAISSGYWLVAADGGVFSYDAPFDGSAGDLPLTKPIVGMAVDDATGGYWLAAADGGVFSYGAPFEGSAGGLPLTMPVVAMAGAGLDGPGYWLFGADGGVFNYGAPFDGSGAA